MMFIYQFTLYILEQYIPNKKEKFKIKQNKWASNEQKIMEENNSLDKL